ncbi:MAG: DNA mismatch repair endonuclease MutL [Rikenellaceae bacterium]|nr:DNA mismatch repair endonuclease MutL [Rikenellaceae bacterium]
MADCIKLLPEIVANQIKAGEVVESPSSVVKEMMENAIDAGASEVTVNFVNGGRDLVQIIDNGRGMSPMDARMAFECHATSKIASLDDIYALHTFGFRGEALSSIAAVSQVELITRQADCEVGTQTIINGGEFISQTPTAAPVGSQFLVRNLFYNTPARRKFVNGKESSLSSEIKREFRRVALCHPEVACTLLNNSAPIYSLPESSLVERIIGIMGNATRRNLLEVDVETSIATVKGYVGRPETARNNSSEQYMFVNGRFFRSPYLNKAVTKAYEKLIPEKGYPSFFLYITVDAERVDVNVHAQKTEVKFADNEAIWQILNAAVRETLAKNGAMPLIDFEAEELVDIPVATTGVSYAEPRATTKDNYNPFAENYTSERSSTSSPSKDEWSAIPQISAEFDLASTIDFGSVGRAKDADFDYLESGEGETQSLEFEIESHEEPSSIALCGGRYAVATFATKTLIVDLARARERLLFNHYVASLQSGHAVSQQLLFPELLTLTEEEFDLMEEYAVDFASLGFDIKAQGGNTIEVFGVPADVRTEQLDKAIYDLLQSLKYPQSAVELRRNSLAQALAHSESLGVVNFTKEDAERLTMQILASAESYTYAGKRIISALSLSEIKKMFE